MQMYQVKVEHLANMLDLTYDELIPHSFHGYTAKFRDIHYRFHRT